MQINSSTNNYLATTLPSRDQDHLEQQSLGRAGKKPVPEQPPRFEPGVSSDISEAARQAANQQQVIAVNASERNQSTYQYYPSERKENLTSVQQKALQAYDTNQQMSREDQVSGEFLGGLDVFA